MKVYPSDKRLALRIVKMMQEESVPQETARRTLALVEKMIPLTLTSYSDAGTLPDGENDADKL